MTNATSLHQYTINLYFVFLYLLLLLQKQKEICITKKGFSSPRTKQKKKRNSQTIHIYHQFIIFRFLAVDLFVAQFRIDINNEFIDNNVIHIDNFKCQRSISFVNFSLLSTFISTKHFFFHSNASSIIIAHCCVCIQYYNVACFLSFFFQFFDIRQTTLRNLYNYLFIGNRKNKNS